MPGGRKKNKNKFMPDYIPTDEDLKAMRYCIDNRICKISPLAKNPGNTNSEWYLEVYLNGKWNKSPEAFGPEVWEVLFNYYKYYYNKYKDE